MSLSQSEKVLKLGESVSVICDASGHPTPTIQWLDKSKENIMVIGIQLFALILEWGVFFFFLMDNISTGNQVFLLYPDGISLIIVKNVKFPVKIIKKKVKVLEI